MHLFYYVLNFMFLIVVAVVNGQNRIVGGNRVKYRENFPYQISLRVHGQHICGGTIYKPQYVITAAHCMHNIKASQLEIVAGDLNLRYPSKHTQRSKVSKIHVHKGFNDAIENDVAVLQLKNKLLFNDYVGNITIWNSTEIGSDPKETQPCVVSGWGAKEYNGNVINDLTFANVTLFSPEMCKLIYSSTFYLPGMVCAGNFTHARDACTGDSGGPLVCEGRLYGIVSWGIRCGLPHFPGIYTNASFYNSWIEANHGIGINFNRFHCIGVFILLLYLFI